jgi:protease I
MEQVSAQSLQGKRVAVLMTDGVQQVEYSSPRAWLEERGATVVLLAPKAVGSIVQGSDGATFAVELDVADARPMDFDALLLPGGAANADRLRASKAALAFVADFDVEDKMVAAICHGPRILIDAGLATARHLTSAPGLKQDLLDAGAEWTDEPVVVDMRLVTSRGPDDLAAFNDAIVKELLVAEGTDPGPTS